MKNILTYLFPILIFACQHEQNQAIEVPLHYELELAKDTMHVAMTYLPISPDSTVLHYGNPFFGGMKDQLNSLINIKTAVKYRTDTIQNQLIIYHTDNQPIKINYDIIDTHLPTHRVVGEMFRTIITDSYFFSLSNTLFLHPQVADSLQETMRMSVKAVSNPPYPLYYSFSPQLAAGETANISWKEGLNALTMGASDLHIEKRELGGIMNYIVLRIHEKNGYNRERFMHYFDTFMPAMTDFWGNLEGDYYSLIAAPFVDIDYHKISGTAFQNGFHVKYSGDTLLADNEVVQVISHEVMHRYIGAGRVSLGENHQWFDEGFTDYTTLLLLSDCGMISKEKFHENIRKTYQELSANPHRNLPNEEVMKHFWESKSYEKLPYHRGALFAAYLHHQMTASGQNPHTFRDFMRDLKNSAQISNQLTLKDFTNSCSKYLPKEQVDSDLENYIMQGMMVPEELIFGGKL
jgi:predicted metalloprotease with PDZ domain